MSFKRYLKKPLEVLGGKASKDGCSVSFKNKNDKIIFYSTNEYPNGLDGKNKPERVEVRLNGEELKLDTWLHPDTPILMLGNNMKNRKGSKRTCPVICKNILLDKGFLDDYSGVGRNLTHENIIMPEEKILKKIYFELQNNNLNIGAVWTYLIARIYVNKIPVLAQKLCGQEEIVPTNPKIWLEARMFPTRKNWESIPDLSIGYFERCKKTQRQLRSDGNWICVAETKCLDNLNTTEFDSNQLTKMIEHAILLNSRYGEFPQRVYVTLITPKYFKEKKGEYSEKTYWEQYHKYKKDPKLLKNDLESCTLPFLSNDYETLMIKRIENLTLNWVTFEELLGIENLFEDDKPRFNRDSWSQIFKEMGREDLIEKLLT